MKCKSKKNDKKKLSSQEQNEEKAIKSLKGIIMSVNFHPDEDAEIELEMEDGRIILFFVNPHIVIKSMQGSKMSLDEVTIDSKVELKYLLNDKNQKEIVGMSIIR
ncbi:MAG: hypothetical protein ACMUJM_19920 [bacterium]